VLTRYSAPAEEIVGAWAAAKFFVCRAGYSTVLDLACQGKPAVLIPTPGQTEQLQVAQHLAHHNSYRICTQAQLLSGRMPAAGELLQLPQRQPIAGNLRATEELRRWLHS
jgi:UDP-N-acetylglucosamine:LPS N-acetylglucosamine transferase